MEQNSLAYEMLKELKSSRKCLFAIVIIEAIIIVSMFTGFLVYESQFDYVTSMEQSQENIDSSSATQSIN